MPEDKVIGNSLDRWRLTNPAVGAVYRIFAGSFAMIDFLDPGFILIIACAVGVILVSALSKVVPTNNPLPPEIVDAQSTVHWTSAIVMPLVGSTILVLCLYFLSSMMIVMTISFSCISCVSIFSLMYVVLPHTPEFNKKLFRLPLLGAEVTVRTLLSGLIAGAMLATWFLRPYWYMSNVIALCLCWFMMQCTSLPNLKIASLLLAALFVYDIFWVFYSKPIFGKNVMVTVATSLRLPMLLEFPRLFGDRAVMLGLGDIVFPGIVICYTLKIDLHLHNLRLTPPTVDLVPMATAPDVQHKDAAVMDATVTPGGSTSWLGVWREASYMQTAMAGYLVGLVVAYAAVTIMNHPQPALLYLVPLTLGPPLVRSLPRHHLGLLWNGV
ncbi:putative Signal peptide peptidase family protein [Paratrimastix pyriformis]|uniref:Signal peptide peptidase family protein n=1 Tax=Paratrimastix pyriformis TaxID=342808 RepID=A0ABQ8UTZ7_9EUKA|nr:putative Signal peptide peptidase family protein [Paratrimastix pyriformis]